MGIDIKELTNLIHLCEYGINNANRTAVYKKFSEILGLQNNGEWKSYCGKNDPRHCKEYLNFTIDDNLAIDGRTLKDYPAEKITLEKVETALKAQAPLTIPMIKSCKKIRDIITNSWLAKMAIRNSTYYTYGILDSKQTFNYEFLQLWKRKDKLIKEVFPDKSFEEWLDLVDLPYVYDTYTQHYYNVGPEKTFRNPKWIAIFENIGMPDEVLKVGKLVKDFYLRYEAAEDEYYKRRNGSRCPHEERMKYVPLFENEEEDNECRATCKLLRLYEQGNSRIYDYKNDCWESKSAAAHVLVYYMKLKMARNA